MTGASWRRYPKREEALLYETAIRLLHWAGVIVYGGSLLSFAVLLAIPARRSQLGRHRVLTAFRAWGVAMGLAMGSMILGGLLWHYQRYGGFSLSTDAGNAGLVSAKYAVFSVLWVSAFHLEIWTLEPLRGEDLEAEIQWAATVRATRQIQFNALLFVAVAVLASAARFSGPGI